MPGPSGLLQEAGDLQCGGAGAVEHLAVGQPDGAQTAEGGIQVAIEVTVPRSGVVVVSPSVEFDDQPVVRRVPVDATDGPVTGRLTGPPWQAVSTFHALDVAVLERRMDALGEVAEDRGEPSAVG